MTGTVRCGAGGLTHCGGSDAILASINAEFGEKSWWDTLWGSSNKGK